MDNGEREAIKNYKEYQLKWLPNAKTLEKLYAADFEIEYDSYSENRLGDVVDRLKIYLDVLREYTKRIVRAAHLRQKHFEMFLVEATEDKDHRDWRLGMNEIAVDCQEKLAYWTNFQNQEFDKLVTNRESEERRNRKLPRYLRAENVDHKRSKNSNTNNKKSRTGKGMSKKVIKVCRPPQMSRLQQIRFSEQLRRQVRENEDKMIEVALEKNLPFHETVESVAEHDRNIPKITITELIAELTDHGYNEPLGQKFNIAEIPSAIMLVEAETEQEKLREKLNKVACVFLDGFSTLISEACRRYGCINIHKCYMSDSNISNANADVKDLLSKMKVLICYHHVIGRHNDDYNHYGDGAMLSWIAFNKRVPLENILVLHMLSYLCSEMHDDLFVSTYKQIKSRQIELLKKDEVMDVNRIQEINHCKVLNHNLCKIYPKASYTQRIINMEDVMSSGYHLGGQYVYKMGWLDVVEIDRRRIEREIGVKLFVASDEKERYHKTLTKFMQFIK